MCDTFGVLLPVFLPIGLPVLGGLLTFVFVGFGGLELEGFALCAFAGKVQDFLLHDQVHYNGCILQYISTYCVW